MRDGAGRRETDSSSRSGAAPLLAISPPAGVPVNLLKNRC